MSFDYTFQLKNKDGRVVSIGYQEMLKKLDAEDMIVQGQPLKAGGSPQAAIMKTLIEKVVPDVSVTVLLNGNAII